MSRIPYPEVDALSDDNKAFLEKLAPLNLFRMLSHAPHLLKPFVGLGTAFLQQGKLDPVTRECVILRVGYLSNAKYETTQHEAIGLAVDMDEELIAAVKAGPHADG